MDSKRFWIPLLVGFMTSITGSLAPGVCISVTADTESRVPAEIRSTACRAAQSASVDSGAADSESSRSKASGPAEPTVFLDVLRNIEDVVFSLQKTLPEPWKITAIRRGQAPRKWNGSKEAVLIRLENPSMVVYHPRGFEYHPFYKIWLCPPQWQGNMEEVKVLGNEGPSVLLGQNHKMKVFYLTLGANDWPEGPGELREALDLTQLHITNRLKQRIDPSMKMKLFPVIAPFSNGSPDLLSRIVGMEKDGPLVYLEYATGTKRRIDGHLLPSRCREPRVLQLMERENLFLADRIFLAYSDVQTIYLRRLCDEFLTDRIINRPDEISGSPPWTMPEPFVWR